MRRSLFVLLTIVAMLFVRVPVRADDLVLDRFGDYLEALRTQAGIPGLRPPSSGATISSGRRRSANRTSSARSRRRPTLRSSWTG
jgi:hypothetical protein